MIAATNTVPINGRNQTPRFQPIDFSRCPQRGHQELAGNQNYWLDGIFAYLYRFSGSDLTRLSPYNDFQIVSIDWEDLHPPLHSLHPDNLLYFQSKSINQKQPSYIGFKFRSINIRPTAICLQSHFSPHIGTVVNAPRSFIVVGITNIDNPNSPNVIIAEYNYTEELKENRPCIFYLNTDQYFPGIYIMNRNQNFSHQNCLCIQQIELHGLIKRV